MTLCDCDLPQAESTDVVVARKPWRCVECRTPIAVGEKHVRWSVLFDGKWQRARMCLTCQAINHELHERIAAHNAEIESALRRLPEDITERAAVVRRIRDELCDCWGWGALWSNVAEYCHVALGYDQKETR